MARRRLDHRKVSSGSNKEKMYWGHIPARFSHCFHVPADHNAARRGLALPLEIREWEGECPHEPKEEWCREKGTRFLTWILRDFALTLIVDGFAFLVVGDALRGREMKVMMVQRGQVKKSTLQEWSVPMRVTSEKPYSCLRASITSALAARRAGYSPAMTPMPAHIIQL